MNDSRLRCLVSGPELSVPTRILFDSSVSPGARLLAVILASVCLQKQKTTLLFSSYQSLADEIGFTKDQVMTYTSELERENWLGIVTDEATITFEML